jgi:opacity protein-like surface antigen
MKAVSGFIIAVTLFGSLPLFAQNRVGLVTGLNVANLSIDSNDPDQLENTSRTGFALGAVVEMPWKNKLGLRVEPMYIQKGAKSEGEFSDGDAWKIDINLKYLEIPAFVTYTFDAGTIKPFALIGPMLGIRLGATRTITIAGDEGDGVDVGNMFNGVDLGLALGGGVSYPVHQNINAFVEARYAFGIKNVSDIDDTAKTRGLQLLAGVTMPFGL